ncbi:hypothetical protein ANN_17256 [Periplaneta americana]|uniref:Uncharacterized protein n=1 Tax=Periplaneta americana TaxID=6978 RepID=A0ABQ8STM2_PERAM|nr:hypothetical protein ANN_17256 [Periplaneta americana]
MAVLCEGGNEPAGSLKAICEIAVWTRHLIPSLVLEQGERRKDDNNALSELAMRISYKICHESAEELKTFNEGEFIKRCLIILADEPCPQQVGEVEAIRLSRRTVVRRLQYARMDYVLPAARAQCVTFILAIKINIVTGLLSETALQGRVAHETPLPALTCYIQSKTAVQRRITK